MDTSSLFRESEIGLSGHTEQIFGVNDPENEGMFGAVYSPENSMGHHTRDSALFSPALSIHQQTPSSYRPYV